jgi:hypothetical protein
MSPAEVIAEARVLRGTAEGIQNAAEDAEDEAQKAVLSPEGAERALRIAGLLVGHCRALAEGLHSIADKARAFIRAGGPGDRGLLAIERASRRCFASGELAFDSVRGLIRYLQSHRLSPSGAAELEASAARLEAAREGLLEGFADLKDPRLQQSIRQGLEEALRATGEPWDWKKELFGGADE